MKKISVLIMIAAVLALYAPGVFAKNGSTVTGVANQNQVKTQNMGEEQQLVVQTAEQEEASVGTKSAAPRSENALEHMSIVAKSVEEILTDKTLYGGIGDQVREIAQAQKQSQDQVQLQINKMENRDGLVKALFGPDYKALNNIEKQIVQNELRIQQLTELKNQLFNTGDISMVQETIEALISQNTSLQEMVSLENKIRSLFGWLAKLLVR